MLKTITCLILLFVGVQTTAQITLTNAYFPAVGDTLRYGVADSTFTVDLLSPGPARQWDFGTQAAASTRTQVVSAAADTTFTEADVAVDLGDSTVGFYRLTETSYDLIGIRSTIDLFPGYQFAAPFSPARAERRAPLRYGDLFSSLTNNVLVIAREEIPEEALELVGDVISNVDSIRITSESNRDDEVDAYGTLTLNGQTYEVLRERRTETVNTTIEVKSGFLPYLNVTSLVRAQVPETTEFFGQQPPVTTYYYWTNGEKEPVAAVTVDEEGTPSEMTFTRGDATNSVGGPLLAQAQVRVYPNPARGHTTFEVSGLDPGTYTLSVINVLGRKVSTTRFSPVGTSAEVWVDVSMLPRGPYLYSLTNERGRILTTRRLLVGR
ncbi:T9SS type A sorting domain-containing protein [Lewinella sp. JB7]|uniref:T9SS type A sorting domain-containing protein n=1 Tax=Lewinella sp. JB7 TaxID=2962887 RepID=UPI0020C96365|nr:T9SS type A sorting domain-containing protein [Lewinella sp. JB7]MCP9234952.1 T9SS type A sorting domain-containing protein [Lewinella sp. JB7]